MARQKGASLESVWEVAEGVLWLADRHGNRSAPSAIEIYSALVQRAPNQHGVPTTCLGLRASRYPLSPMLTITVDSDGVPSYSIVGNLKGEKIVLSASDLEREYRIAEGVWYPLDPEASREILALSRELGIQEGPVRSLRAFLALRHAGEAGKPVDDLTSGVAISPLVFTPPSDSSPVGIDARLYGYQLAGWRWLKFLLAEGVGGLLADEMGLGKTLQVISVLSDSGAASLAPSLIVVPGSLLENWRREIAKFAPHLSVLKHHGPARTGRPAALEGYDVVVTSYDNAVSDNGLLNMIPWKAIILDEAQYIRNPNAQRTKAVKRLQREVGLAITGTPVQNGLLDLWSIIDFALPGYLGEATAFSASYPDHADGAQKLEQVVSPLMLRRRVADVAKDLPPRINIPQILELTPEEASAYDAERDRIVTEYGASATLVALTSLRRFCAHPSLMSGTSETEDPMSFSKFRRLKEIVEEIFSQGEKVLIFTSFTRMADMIARHISASHGAFVGVIDGRLAIDERQPLIDRFSAVREGAALVLNPQAGGTGLNITAANHVIHYNPEWNPAIEDQASARSYRRGQELPVTIHRLLIASSVEEVVDDRLSRKRCLAEAAVVGVEGKDEDYGDIVKALSASPSKV